MMLRSSIHAAQWGGYAVASKNQPLPNYFVININKVSNVESSEVEMSQVKSG